MLIFGMLLLWAGLTGGLFVRYHHRQQGAHHLYVFLAVATLLWGLMIAQPWSDAFAGAAVFHPLIALAGILVPSTPATGVWGSIAALLGGIQLLTLVSSPAHYVQGVYAVAAGWWLFVVVMVTVLPLQLSPATAVYSMYAAGCAFIVGYEDGGAAHG